MTFPSHNPNDPLAIHRRQVLQWGGYGLGAMALQSLLSKEAGGAPLGSTGGLHYRATTKRVIFLTQSGAPSQIELFDPKPQLVARSGQELPGSVSMGQRLTTMTAGQSRMAVMPAVTTFKPYGESGIELGDWIPHIAGIADDICVVRSMQTDFINHAPALTFMLTGSQLPGRPSLGAWSSFGLGTLNANLPEFAVLVSKTGNSGDQPLYDYYWGAGFLPSRHQAAKLRGGAEPVLYLKNPAGIDRQTRRLQLDALAELNQHKHDAWSDPEITTRIAQYEMAYKMQRSVPELADLSQEPQSTFDLYGEEAKEPGTYAFNCLMARRMVERDVRFVQVFLGDWDHHVKMRTRSPARAATSDRPSAALVRDLKQRGMLDDTLVVWAGEFGRGVTAQTKSSDPLSDPNVGRDHHPRCFSLWMAGGGLKRGHVHGATDDYCYNVVENPVHIHDLQATILRLMGVDHERLTYRFMGRDFRLTDVHGRVVHDIIA
ncbi:hypothetical protein Pla175_30390 [Pirellulimonas nuda]|uniref:Sulfatase n=1 Tax=Pirellulimonas nuda TaxID=2528009 RepID=A0A518DDW0_9BACT|nr:DUF1501 domain-containing protein [Pirellulimonas nuda]QDU89646.1 hypothetical protein Pla175_30390 [Pirellulimonas nuda]